MTTGLLPRPRARFSPTVLLAPQRFGSVNTLSPPIYQTEPEEQRTCYPPACFEEFARFAPVPSVAFPIAGARDLVAKWIALSCPARTPIRTAMHRCQHSMPKLFTVYRSLELFSRSFFLPSGESMFGVLQNPQRFPETPPDQVMAKFLSGLLSFPGSDFFYLEPVIKRIEKGRYIALSRTECEKELLLVEQHVAFLVKKNARWWRTQHNLVSAALCLERFGIQAVDFGIGAAFWTLDMLFRPVRWVIGLGSLLERLHLESLAETADQLSDPMLRHLAAKAERLRLPEVSAKFRSRVRRWDPLLTFFENGVHRLVGHWYEVSDQGKKFIRWHL